MTGSIIAIIIAIIVVLAILALIAVLMSSKKKNQQREQAQQLRQGAAQYEPQLQNQQQAAAQAQQEADRHRAEADRAAAQAREAEQRAAATQQQTDGLRQDYEQQHREADRLDPDVKTDSEGNRVDGSAPGDLSDSDQHTQAAAYGGRDTGANPDTADRFADNNSNDNNWGTNDASDERHDTESRGATAAAAGAAGSYALPHDREAGHVADSAAAPVAADSEPAAYSGAENTRGGDFSDGLHGGNFHGQRDSARDAAHEPNERERGLAGLRPAPEHEHDSQGGLAGTAGANAAGGRDHHGGYDEQGQGDLDFHDGLAGGSGPTPRDTQTSDVHDAGTTAMPVINDEQGQQPTPASDGGWYQQQETDAAAATPQAGGAAERRSDVHDVGTTAMPTIDQQDQQAGGYQQDQQPGGYQQDQVSQPDAPRSADSVGDPNQAQGQRPWWQEEGADGAAAPQAPTAPGSPAAPAAPASSGSTPVGHANSSAAQPGVRDSDSPIGRTADQSGVEHDAGSSNAGSSNASSSNAGSSDAGQADDGSTHESIGDRIRRMRDDLRGNDER
ncbi:hypothetical protein [Calidifontibacter terrae]